MRSFRVYLIDDGRHIVDCRVLTAKSDDAAIRDFSTWRVDGPALLELWDRERRLASMTAAANWRLEVPDARPVAATACIPAPAV